ncbi:Hypothetical protein, putative [Bodo saltans]|uniref:WD40 repeat-containing protein n=1 Tax=Bodo saltans TaxID=75058 RepID=A0A0S4IY54_BODSA|nr:Hypothetical protein, putative [Bodo saltans]|eukprot:CUG06771.1 Hypothetical protein, putative [Bodo saltans]
MEKVPLSDGTTATVVPLSQCISCCTVDGHVWVIHSGDRYISVRNPQNGAVVSRVDMLTDDAIALAKVGPRVWVATASGKLLIHGTDGILLGVLQASTIPSVTQFYNLSGSTSSSSHYQSTSSSASSSVVTSGGGKDFHLWDMSQFVVERTFLGRIPGEVITSVSSAHRSHLALLATSSAAIRLWSIDGTVLAEVPEGAVHAICLPRNDDSFVAWVAQTGWITIFSATTTRRTTQLKREKTLPCAVVQQLFSVDARQVGALDAEGLVTIWNTTTLLPVRTFKVAAQLDLVGLNSAAAAGLFCLPTVERRAVTMWCCSNSKALVWEDLQTTDLQPGSQAVEDTPVDLEREEIRFLRRKLKVLESMATMYRQKVGILFREGRDQSSATGSTSSSPYRQPGGGGISEVIQAFNDTDRAFAKALESWDNDNKEQEPIPDTTLQVTTLTAADAMEFTEYWKRKYYQMVEEFSGMRKEHEGLIDMINQEHHQQQHHNHQEGGYHNTVAATGSEQPPQLSLDGKRAMFLTKLIKEKNDLRERNMQLADDVTKLRGLLKNQALGIAGADSSLEAIDFLRQESQDLRRELRDARQQLEQGQEATAEAQRQQKQNQLLKQRVKKLRAELDIAQVQLSEATAVMQRDYHSLLDSIQNMEQRSREHERAARTFDLNRAQLELEITTLKTDLDGKQQLSTTLSKELQQRESVEARTLAHLQEELTLMCQSLDDRDAKVSELIQQNHMLTDQVRDLSTTSTNQRRTLEGKDVEIEALQDRLQTLERVVHDRRTYATAVDELQGRLEMVVEELRHGFTPVQFSANISDLEGRISNLFALESQLRQKDDIIAIRDDEIALLKEHVARVEGQVEQVSAIFSQLPRSVEEVEQLTVEVDEYRRRLGDDAETQEMVQLRLLELKARRQATASAPFAFELSGESH